MKWVIIALLSLVGFLQSIHAQDRLFLKDGSEVLVQVLEVFSESIKYKRFENPSGPIYFIPKTEVVRIVYQNGQIEEITAIQKKPDIQPVSSKLRYGGPRIGLTYLQAGESKDQMNDIFERDINPIITQFGWQFETRFFTLDNGAAGLIELIPMFGGMEQGLLIPSITAMVGYRSAKGFELGLGPTLSLGGSGILIAAGSSFRSGKVVFPINIAFIPSVTKSYQNVLIESEYLNPITGLYEIKTELKPAHTEHTGFRITLTIGFNSRSK